jgi:hypothetical protein
VFDLHKNADAPDRLSSPSGRRDLAMATTIAMPSATRGNGGAQRDLHFRHHVLALYAQMVPLVHRTEKCAHFADKSDAKNKS